jgi:hypothetical protein
VAVQAGAVHGLLGLNVSRLKMSDAATLNEVMQKLGYPIKQKVFVRDRTGKRYGWNCWCKESIAGDLEWSVVDRPSEAIGRDEYAPFGDDNSVFV